MRARLFGGIQSRAGYPHFNGPAAGGGYLLPVGQKVKVRGAAGSQSARSPGVGMDRLIRLPSRPNSQGTGLVNRRYLLSSNPNKAALWFLKIGAHPAVPLRGNEMTTASLSQDRTGGENAAGEIAWSVLDAANDLGDTITVDACRRVIDASLRGDAPAESDMSVIAAFFN